MVYDILRRKRTSIFVRGPADRQVTRNIGEVDIFQGDPGITPKVEVSGG